MNRRCTGIISYPHLGHAVELMSEDPAVQDQRSRLTRHTSSAIPATTHSSAAQSLKVAGRFMSGPQRALNEVASAADTDTPS